MLSTLFSLGALAALAAAQNTTTTLPATFTLNGVAGPTLTIPRALTTSWNGTGFETIYGTLDGEQPAPTTAFPTTGPSPFTAIEVQGGTATFTYTGIANVPDANRTADWTGAFQANQTADQYGNLIEVLTKVDGEIYTTTLADFNTSSFAPTATAGPLRPIKPTDVTGGASSLALPFVALVGAGLAGVAAL